VLGVLSKSIGRWSDNYATQGHVDPLSVLRGRPRLLTANAVQDLRELIAESPSLYLDKIGEWLALYHDQPIPTSTLHDNLKELGLMHKIVWKAAAERDDAARAAWLHDTLSNFTAEQMVFLDESSKDSRTIFCKYGRAPRGERPVVEVSFDRGIRYSILPALTLDGYLAVRVVEGSVDGAEFYDFIVNDVVSPELKLSLPKKLNRQLPNMNAFPGPQSVIIVDN
jgi:transposase